MVNAGLSFKFGKGGAHKSRAELEADVEALTEKVEQLEAALARIEK